MRRNGSSLLLLLAFLLTACASAPPAPRTVSITEADLCTAPGRLLGNTAQSVIAALGAPSDRFITTLPNRHVRGVEDRRIILRFEALDVLIHEVPEYSSSFLAQVHVRRDQERLFPALIGTDARDLIDILPRIRIDSATRATYECPGELPPSVTFVFENNRVSLIHWIHEPD